MATAFVIEEERGTCNGYFAGDFGRQPALSGTPAGTIGRIAPPVELRVVPQRVAHRTVTRLAA